MVVRFLEYLQLLAKLRLNNYHLKHQHFIIGNSSSDYDSFFGSLIYSYMKYLLFETLFIPLIDCPKQEVKLRFEVSFALERHKIDFDKLFYSSEFPDLSNRTNVLLYDHNVRNGIKPVEIIDHHALKDKECQRKIVLHCGSALTLLYYTLHPEQLKDNQLWQQAFQNYQLPIKETSNLFDYEVDELIRMGILMDSYNFNPREKQRWVQEDLTAVKNIEARASGKQLVSFQQLENVKFDVKRNLELPIDLLMKKDFKLIQYGPYQIAYSIALLSPQLFLKNYGRQSIRQYVQKYNKNQNVNSYFVMFLFEKQNKYHRQLIYYTHDTNLLEKISKILESMHMNLIQERQQPIRFQHWVDPSGIISRKTLDKQFNKDLK